MHVPIRYTLLLSHIFKALSERSFQMSLRSGCASPGPVLPTCNNALNILRTYSVLTLALYSAYHKTNSLFLAKLPPSPVVIYFPEHLLLREA